MIRAGGLVAFPTETVYGLGANALDAAAVARIFAAKGRPRQSPLIVHVDSIEMARALVPEWPDAADRLARRYWPGPLTLVLPKQPVDSRYRDRRPCHRRAAHAGASAGAGADPRGGRAHRRAQRQSVSPSFRPPPPSTSANRSAMPSIWCWMADRPRVGIESTVLSLAGTSRVLLRPGVIPLPEIEALIGPVRIAAYPPRARTPRRECMRGITARARRCCC